jgi:3',5'-cyclic AMP phosphodiesterase CpdA
VELPNRTPEVPATINEVNFVRILTIGGFGISQKHLKSTIAKIDARYVDEQLDGVWLLGGNFRHGISPILGAQDSKFSLYTDIFTNPISALRSVDFNVVIGNEDRRGSIEGLLNFDHKNWEFPHVYYFKSFHIGEVLVCTWFLDTSEVGFNNDQIEWLVSSLSSSKVCTWRVAVGNHPVLTAGEEHDWSRTAILKSRLKPIFDKHKVDLYISSHEYYNQVLHPDDDHATVYVVSGDISDIAKKIKPKEPSSIWIENRKYGFTEFVFLKNRINILFHASDTPRATAVPYKAFSIMRHDKSHTTPSNGFKNDDSEIRLGESMVLKLWGSAEIEDVLYSMYPPATNFRYDTREVFMTQSSNGGMKFAILGDWGNPGEELNETAKLLANIHHGKDIEHTELSRIDEMNSDISLLMLGGKMVQKRCGYTWFRCGLDRKEQEIFAGNLHAVLMLGDSFYPTGIRKNLGINDPQFLLFTDILAGKHVNIPFYTILGNHDYMGSISAQLDYHKFDPRWNMPSRYYWKEFIYRNVNACIWFLDTIRFDATQLQWLEHSLAIRKCQWKLVLGHHPVFTAGEYAESLRISMIRQKLIPILRQGNVDIYIAGHEHQSQLLRDDSEHKTEKPTFIITGATSDRRDPTVNQIPNCIWIDPETFGFPIMTVKQDSIAFEFKNAHKPFNSPAFKYISIKKVSDTVNSVSVNS